MNFDANRPVRPLSSLSVRRPRKTEAWTWWLTWSLAGLAGCATFDSKYEQVEIRGPQPELKADSTPADSSSTESKSVETKSADKKSVEARPIERKSVVSRGNSGDEVGRAALEARTTPRPLTITKPGRTTKPATSGAASSGSAIEQIAYFQKGPEQADKGGITVPEVGGDVPKKAPANGAKTSVDTAPPLAAPAAAPGDQPIEIGTPAGASGINLDQTINYCLIADPVIRAGLESINQANADALTASLKPNPQFFTDIQLLPLTRPFTPTRQGGPPQFDAIVSYPIDWFLFGKRAAAMQAADYGVRVSESEYQDLIRVRVLEAAIAYYGVLEARALRDVARQDTENFRRIELLTSSAVENGGRPLVELNRIRLDRLRSEQSLRDAENALVAAISQLRVLLGRDDADPEFDVVGTLESSSVIEPLPLNEAVDIAEQNRPDLEAARWKIAEADAIYQSELRKAYPTLIPSFGYTRQYQNKAIGFPDADSWLANLTMSVPIFDRNQGHQSKAASISAQAGYQLQARRVALRGEVVRATQALTTAAANAQAVAQEQLQIARQVRDSINSAYEAGGRPLIDALDAQRNYRETYRLFITSRADYARAEMRYSATLGRQMTH